jgi:hypothetical protein
MFAMAAWYNWNEYGADSVKREDDRASLLGMTRRIEHLISQNDVWNRLPQITERKWQVIRRRKPLFARRWAQRSGDERLGQTLQP